MRHTHARAHTQSTGADESVLRELLALGISTLAAAAPTEGLCSLLAKAQRGVAERQRGAERAMLRHSSNSEVSTDDGGGFDPRKTLRRRLAVLRGVACLLDDLAAHAHTGVYTRVGTGLFPQSNSSQTHTRAPTPAHAYARSHTRTHEPRRFVICQKVCGTRLTCRSTSGRIAGWPRHRLVGVAN